MKKILGWLKTIPIYIVIIDTCVYLGGVVAWVITLIRMVTYGSTLRSESSFLNRKVACSILASYVVLRTIPPRKGCKPLKELARVLPPSGLLMKSA